MREHRLCEFEEAVDIVTAAVESDLSDESVETVVDYCIAEFGNLGIDKPFAATLAVLDRIDKRELKNRRWEECQG